MLPRMTAFKAREKGLKVEGAFIYDIEGNKVAVLDDSAPSQFALGAVSGRPTDFLNDTIGSRNWAHEGSQHRAHANGQTTLLMYLEPHLLQKRFGSCLFLIIPTPPLWYYTSVIYYPAATPMGRVCGFPQYF